MEGICSARLDLAVVPGIMKTREEVPMSRGQHQGALLFGSREGSECLAVWLAIAGIVRLASWERS